MKNTVIFCSLNGTITTNDTMDEIMHTFAPNTEWETWKNQIVSQYLPIQTGMQKMFSLLPSSLKEDISQYVVNNTTIREGFEDFVQFTNMLNIPLYIIRNKFTKRF